MLGRRQDKWEGERQWGRGKSGDREGVVMCCGSSVPFYLIIVFFPIGFYIDWDVLMAIVPNS